ncbi:LacI family DNA-binding transcriptional regulator [Shewanella marina]|uniref:LacI family DNA-binding transcriptional regulator n=1 Tax=Shewanella marina TaxID=487319 RepID=UPI0004721E72|nr:LacI family DNA-binding transcriptional regulator [Shewanella marina]
MKPTIKDVAKLAQVSITTVSFVINNSKPVKAETKEKVLKAINHLGYRHNGLAASLKTANQGLKSIGVIGLVEKNPFFSELIMELEQACLKQGYTMLSCFTRINEDQQKLADFVGLLYGKVAGIIFLSINDDDNATIIDNIAAMPIVGISFDHHTVHTQCGSSHLELNNYNGGYIAGTYLAAQGHQHLACVTGNIALQAIKDRLHGFEQALTDKQCPIATVMTGDFSYQSGYQAMSQLLNLSPRPTAVFCHNDLMAIGMQNAAHDLGLHIPRDLAVIGYDNINAAEIAYPPLTTIDLSLTELSDQAVQGMINKIEHGVQDVTISISPSLVVRKSA